MDNFRRRRGRRRRGRRRRGRRRRGHHPGAAGGGPRMMAATPWGGVGAVPYGLFYYLRT